MAVGARAKPYWLTRRVKAALSGVQGAPPVNWPALTHELEVTSRSRAGSIESALASRAEKTKDETQAAVATQPSMRILSPTGEATFPLGAPSSSVRARRGWVAGALDGA